jgi:uncharacterized protein YjbJ (UPF0337 family)
MLCLLPITEQAGKQTGKNQIKGAAHEVKVKEQIGRTFGNDEMERDCKLEHAKGSMQKAAADVQRNIRKATTSAARQPICTAAALTSRRC